MGEIKIGFYKIYPFIDLKKVRLELKAMVGFLTRIWCSLTETARAVPLLCTVRSDRRSDGLYFPAIKTDRIRIRWDPDLSSLMHCGKDTFDSADCDLFMKGLKIGSRKVTLGIGFLS